MYKVLYISDELDKDFKNIFDKKFFNIKNTYYKNDISSQLDNINLVFLNKPKDTFIKILKLKSNYPETKFVISINDIYPHKMIEIINNYADEVILDNKNIYKELIKNGLNSELLSK